MKILGQYDTNGEYIEHREPTKVAQLGDTLRDEDGFVWGRKDDYGDWVSAGLYRVGIKSKLKIDET